VALNSLLTLCPDGPDRFIALPENGAEGRVFGGLLLFHALLAALATVEGERPAHSLHANFQHAGNRERPLVYTVDRMRDGRSYSTRSVLAEQDGRLVLDARVSCQVPADGLAFTASPMPDVPPPETLRSEAELREEALRRTDVEWVGSLVMGGMGVEMRPVCPRDFVNPRVMAPVQHFWVRPVQPVEGDWRKQQAALAYMSDMMLLSTTLLPHGIYWSTTAMDSASLDHVIWFHDQPRFDDWMLWSLEAPWTGGSRGLALGRFYNRDGALVATVAQEGLIRLRGTDQGREIL